MMTENSYGWSGESAPNVEKELKATGFEMAAPCIHIEEPPSSVRMVVLFTLKALILPGSHNEYAPQNFCLSLVLFSTLLKALLGHFSNDLLQSSVLPQCRP